MSSTSSTPLDTITMVAVRAPTVNNNNNYFSIASPFWPQMSAKRVTASRLESNLESDRRKPISELSFSGHTRAVFQKSHYRTAPHILPRPCSCPCPLLAHFHRAAAEPFIVSPVSTSKSSVRHLLRSNYVS